jgi:hypothetical protein
MESTKITAGVRKPKKKQVKDELDRIKQAEKKKRRLEKALATSAAIRSELEKKKQKKKEEQERLDEEGAAIAEAVALHVLLGEDSDDSSVMLKKDEGQISLDRTDKKGIITGGRQSLVPRQNPLKYSLGNIECVSNADRYGCMWNRWENYNPILASGPPGRDFCPQYYGEEGFGTVGLSAGHLAARAVSSLKIADDSRVDAYMFNRMLRG